MNCPVCPNMKLVMTERSGVEIDYCPNCRGVWLDRGELDKIVERAGGGGAAGPAAGGRAAQPVQQQPQQPMHPQQQQRRFDDDNDDSKYGYNYEDPNRRRKKNWLKDMFDL
ncbi:MAG: zf-TFIIB domain-containing protein [Planctomycetaceae bacterium]|nr:zf-TFIIB domain-containing protein [Phycisphaerales bacterium]MCE2653977.1 zf-TFIIB domain-containing protein [Planctomycetaceae bacterium]